MFAIHQVLLAWETYAYDHETDELFNPRPTQPQEMFSRVEVGFMQGTDYKKPNPTKFSANKHPIAHDLYTS